MAVSEDVSEKVASVLFEYLLRSANYVSDVAPTALGAVGHVDDKAFEGVAAIGKNLLEEFEKKHISAREGEVSPADLDQVVQRLKTHVKTICIGDADAKDFEAMLHTEKVLYAKVDMRDDNCKMFMFMYMDKAEEKISHVVEALHARRGNVTELSPKLFIQSLQPDKTLTVQGLDNVELGLFRHYAKELGVLFTAVSRPDGNMLVILAEDAQKARRALIHVGWLLTGREGARIREQVEISLKRRRAINISAEEGTRELYVMSRIRPDNYVKITSEDFKLYKANKQVSTASRKSGTFYSRCIAACEGLTQPVVLSAEEYAEMTPEKLAAMPTLDLFPQEFDDQIEMSIQNRLRDLISQKMSLDNEGDNPMDISDPSITYSEFAQYEYIADEDERLGREMEFAHYQRAHGYAKDHFVFTEVNRDGNTLDFIVAQAEAKKREMLERDAHTAAKNGPSSGEQAHTPDK